MPYKWAKYYSASEKSGRGLLATEGRRILLHQDFVTPFKAETDLGASRGCYVMVHIWKVVDMLIPEWQTVWRKKWIYIQLLLSISESPREWSFNHWILISKAWFKPSEIFANQFNQVLTCSNSHITFENYYIARPTLGSIQRDMFTYHCTSDPNFIARDNI